MSKTILITGATDGIGLETAKALVGLGHTVLIHGRSETRLADTRQALARIDGSAEVQAYCADLSSLPEVERLAEAVADRHTKLDVLINNAGVFKVDSAITAQGYDLRFVVNTIAPYLLTRRLLPLMSPDGRVVNLSSAAQSSVDLDALLGKHALDDSQAYAQSKLALTMWSFHLAQQLGADGPAIIAVNPASFLASKMVKDAYGVAGNDLSIGVEALVQASLGESFANATGRYFDNDQGRFANPHRDALDPAKNAALVTTIERVLNENHH